MTFDSCDLILFILIGKNIVKFYFLDINPKSSLNMYQGFWIDLNFSVFPLPILNYADETVINE
mgnify:FL=1